MGPAINMPFHITHKRVGLAGETRTPPTRKRRLHATEAAPSAKTTYFFPWLLRQISRPRPRAKNNALAYPKKPITGMPKTTGSILA